MYRISAGARFATQAPPMPFHCNGALRIQSSLQTHSCHASSDDVHSNCAHAHNFMHIFSQIPDVQYSCADPHVPTLLPARVISTCTCARELYSLLDDSNQQHSSLPAVHICTYTDDQSGSSARYHPTENPWRQ